MPSTRDKMPASGDLVVTNPGFPVTTGEVVAKFVALYGHLPDWRYATEAEAKTHRAEERRIAAGMPMHRFLETAMYNPDTDEIEYAGATYRVEEQS